MPWREKMAAGARLRWGFVFSDLWAKCCLMIGRLKICGIYGRDNLMQRAVLATVMFHATPWCHTVPSLGTCYFMPAWQPFHLLGGSAWLEIRKDAQFEGTASRMWLDLTNIFLEELPSFKRHRLSPSSPLIRPAPNSKTQCMSMTGLNMHISGPASLVYPP